MGPERVGSQGRARTGQGGTGSPELGQEPGAGTHGASLRRGLLCSAYPWGDRGAGAARPPPPCRLSNSTSGLEEKREGRWGGGERAPGCGGALGGGGAPRCAPRGDSSRACRSLQLQRPELPTVGARGWAVSRTAPGWQAGPGGPGGAWRARQLRPGLRLGGGDGSLSSPGTLSSSGGSRSSRVAGAARGRRAGSRAAPSAGELAKLAKK